MLPVAHQGRSVRPARNEGTPGASGGRDLASLPRVRARDPLARRIPPMSEVRPDYDAIVVGGGPAGSTCSHLLARAGKKVLVLEKETFPRFRIGESLLPYSTPIFARLGVLDELKAKYQRKYGAFFSEEGKEENRKVVFADGITKGFDFSFQAKRA